MKLCTVFGCSTRARSGSSPPMKSRKEYMLERYRKRRDEARERLGGECVVCGSKEDLNFDHIEREKKSFNLSQWWSVSQEKWEAELSKIQLLCGVCHRAKNVWELDKKAAIRTHGTLSSYRYCKCSLCKAAYSQYWQSYKPRKKRPVAPKIKGGLRG